MVVARNVFVPGGQLTFFIFHISLFLLEVVSLGALFSPALATLLSALQEEEVV